MKIILMSLLPYLVPCPPGSYYDGTNCIPCPVTQYQDNAGQTECKKCVSPYTSTVTGAEDCYYDHSTCMVIHKE